MITEQNYSDAMDALLEYENERLEHNTKIIASIIAEVGNETLKSYEDILDGCSVTDKLQIVDKPEGDNNDESFGIFKEVWVDQWSVGDSGDSFEGFIYGRFAKQKCLKIPYAC
jgi:hypothetical protein|tara:strand:- start:98 stop:436 length:339 start_codon:yes stop_codon:yes gene_type:complete